MRHNCYDILGVDCKASTEEIKIAFRQLAKQWHPDLNPQLSRKGEHFTRIHQAYQILCNPKERARHDAELNLRPAKPHPQKSTVPPSRPKPSAAAQKKAAPQNTAKPRPHATPSEQDLVAKKIALFLKTLKELFQFSGPGSPVRGKHPSHAESAAPNAGAKAQRPSFDRVFQTVWHQSATNFVLCSDGVIRRAGKTTAKTRENRQAGPGTAPRHAWRAGLGIVVLLLVKCWQQLFR